MTLKFTYQIINNLKFNFFLLFSHPFSLLYFSIRWHWQSTISPALDLTIASFCYLLQYSLSLSLSLSTLFFAFFTKADRLLLHLYIKSVNAQTLICTVHLVCSTHTIHQAFSFIFFLYRFCLWLFVSFFFNIYYLHVHIQLHQLNKFIQYFHNYLTICTVH